MLVRIEVEFDDTVLSVTQEDRLLAVPSGLSGRSGIAVRSMGIAVGKMIAALSAGSDTTPAVLLDEFHEAVVRSALTSHTCDGVGCC